MVPPARHASTGMSLCIDPPSRQSERCPIVPGAGMEWMLAFRDVDRNEVIGTVRPGGWASASRVIATNLAWVDRVAPDAFAGACSLKYDWCSRLQCGRSARRRRQPESANRAGRAADPYAHIDSDRSST